MTQIHEQPELDCSPGAKMLIERMQTHPEDFGDGGKLRRLVGRFGAEEDEYSARDEKAINAAYEAIKETRLMVSVLEALMAQPEQPEQAEKMKYKAQGRYAAGATDPRTLYGSPIQNDLTTQQRITREMYEDHIEAHKKLIKDKATKVTDQNVLKRVYDQIAGRERIERDN